VKLDQFVIQLLKIQNTDMSEQHTYQEDFSVWIKNLDCHMENREQFLRVQNFQESQLVCLL